MKIKIKSFNGELPDYLTEGKVYEVLYRVWDGMYLINNDKMKGVVIDMDHCAQLDGGEWEVVSD